MFMPGTHTHVLEWVRSRAANPNMKTWQIKIVLHIVSAAGLLVYQATYEYAHSHTCVTTDTCTMRCVRVCDRVGLDPRRESQRERMDGRDCRKSERMCVRGALE